MRTYLITLLSTAFFFLFASELKAQDCKYFTMPEKGTKMEYTMFDRNGKENAKQTQTIVDVKKQGSETVAFMETSKIAKRGKDEPVSEKFELKCDGGNFFMNMNAFTSSFNYEQYQTIQGSEVTVESDDLYYPSDMAVGSKLPDGNLEVTVKINDVLMINAEITIVNRKVEKIEKITSSAGTFECLKITSEILTKTSLSDGTQSKVNQWVAEGVGVVKTESVTGDGKLIGYELLTRIEKPSVE
jgi:hypothetical protein